MTADNPGDKPDDKTPENPHDNPEYRFAPDWIKDLLQAGPEDPLTVKLARMRYDVTRLLQSVRHATKMTQAMAAEAADLKQSMVARLESLKHTANPTLDTLVKYLDALGAELIIGAVRGERVFLPQPSSERIVVLTDEIVQLAAARGLTPTNYVLLCISRAEAAEAAAKGRDLDS